MLAGKLVVVCGYGDVWSSPRSTRSAAMEGLQAVRLDDVIDRADVVLTTTATPAS
jgi:S-adenosylhomocysteine hydrolase